MPQLILLPGLASNAVMWRHQLAALPADLDTAVTDVHGRFHSVEAMAQALGLRIVRVLSAEETGTNVIRPLAGEMQTFARAAAAPPTPVESGTIEVRANVTVTVEVSP